MKVLLLAQFFPPVIGGEERHVQDLAKQLSQRGHDVVVATQATDSTSPAREEIDGYKVARLPTTIGRVGVGSTDRKFAPPFPDPETSLALRKLAKEFAPDVVHAHNWIINSWIPVKAAVKAPLIWTLHAFGLACATHRMMYKGEPCSGPAPRKCLGCSQNHYGKVMGTAIATTNAAMVPVRKHAVDMFISVSHDVARRNGIADADLPQRVIPNFTDVAAAQKDQPLAIELDPALPTEPFILFVGDQSKEKGLLDLIAAHAALQQEIPLVIIGRPVDSLPTNLRDNVFVINGWPYENVVEAFRRCAFSVAPSRWAEPFGLVIIEAMLQGKPVIGSDIGGITDIIEHEKTGLLVEPGNIAALGAAIQLLATDEDLRSKMGEAARSSVQRFDVNDVIAQIESTYLELVESNQRGGGK